MSARARLKRAIRAAIAIAGGIDGAAATVGKSRSLVGNWNNLNLPDTPCINDAQALDEVAAALGQAPAILTARAAELGYVAIRLPDAGAGEDAVTGALIAASAEFGDIAAEVRDATRDGTLSARERDRIVGQIDEAIASLAKMRAVVSLDPGSLSGAGEAQESDERKLKAVGRG